MTSNITRPRATKQYKALIAAPLNMTDAQALEVMGFTDEPAQDERITALTAAGFTLEQATEIVNGQDAKADAKPKGKGKKGKKAKAEAQVEDPEVISPKQAAEALVAQSGLAFTRGRVYGGIDLAKAIVRVSETGTPEIITSSGVGRTSAVLVYRETSGDVAQQNLMKPV